MTKSKFSPEAATDAAENTQPVEENTTDKVQSEAGKRISEAQKGVPKARIIVTSQVEGSDVVAEHNTLCDALVAHNLDKVKDWPAARNALKKDSEYTRPASRIVEGQNDPIEYNVTFRLVSAQWTKVHAEADKDESLGNEQAA